MVTKHPDFDFWIDYHLNKLEVETVFFYVSKMPYYKEIIDKYPQQLPILKKI